MVPTILSASEIMPVQFALIRPEISVACEANCQDILVTTIDAITKPHHKRSDVQVFRIVDSFVTN